MIYFSILCPFEFIVEPFALFNLVVPIIDIFALTVPHSILPEAKVVVTVSYDPPTEPVPLILNILTLIDTLICLSPETVATGITVRREYQLSDNTWVTWVLVKWDRGIYVRDLGLELTE